jgi:hypothetical protein
MSLFGEKKKKKYTFLYRRRSGYFYVLSSLAGRLTPEMTRTSTIEKGIRKRNWRGNFSAISQTVWNEGRESSLL